MLIAEIAALGAALSWALSGMVSIYPTRALGPLAFNRIRMTLVFLMLMAASLVTGAWHVFPQDTIPILMISGLIGIFVGDTALFGTLQRLGPSRTAAIFALNAPMTVVLGWVFLEEHLKPVTLLGCLVVPTGVIISILGRRQQEPESIDSTIGRLRIGLALGLLAALGQAVGAILARPIMETGADPTTASAIRVGTAAMCLLVTGLIPNPIFKAKTKFTSKLVFIIIISGLLGMGIGMTLLLYALSMGNVGVVTTLSATSPILILPMLWLKTKIRPPAMAWVGAVVSFVGIALITFSRL